MVKVDTDVFTRQRLGQSAAQSCAACSRSQCGARYNLQAQPDRIGDDPVETKPQLTVVELFRAIAKLHARNLLDDVVLTFDITIAILDTRGDIRNQTMQKLGIVRKAFKNNPDADTDHTWSLSRTKFKAFLCHRTANTRPSEAFQTRSGARPSIPLHMSV
ncbi:hypothetical protein [Asticcacaulis benevestitus]|uniref:Uncharacterized protein n=1 Tax=Asticcacaulis benevestitus DSM 16100 = ATCC BAA-896 TaxID=1121022 RepID=V4PWE2_9CAUL|nr:hypothetical protein [Asticcacaulis benevestitus]ESQ92676.1 hypothetical protein ABENE_07600 [Asticcacaulis benevestitus DSM 16100 = ATCC BAA-896]